MIEYLTVGDEKSQRQAAYYIPARGWTKRSGARIITVLVPRLMPIWKRDYD